VFANIVVVFDQFVAHGLFDVARAVADLRKAVDGVQVSLWASDPLLANPVAISIDEKGRVYVAECWRRHTSTLDIHMRKEWLDDDLACRTHQDQIAYHEKRLGDKAKDWKVESERIRLLEDKAGKGARIPRRRSATAITTSARASARASSSATAKSGTPASRISGT